MENSAASHTSAYTPTCEDFADKTIDRLTGQQQARKVIALTSRMCSNPESWPRVLTLLLDCKGDLDIAARRLGIGVEALKDSRREVARIAHVIDHTLERPRDRPITMDTLIGCLPSTSHIDRHWSKIITHAVLEAGGFEQVRVEDIVNRTTFSTSIARQYLGETQRLLSIAWTVLERGQELLNTLDPDSTPLTPRTTP